MRQALRRAVALTGCVLVVLAAGGAALAASPGSVPPLPSLKHTNQPDIHLEAKPRSGPFGIPVEESSNWSGYVALPKSGKSTTFTYVFAQYTVPSVNCSETGSSDAFAYHWIGLDGWSDSTVEQDGVADFCVGGIPEYDAWYEMYPAPFSTEFAVNPGDAIQSSVTYSASTRKYSLVLTDETTGQGFSVSAACGTAGTCDNSSAEDITEGYTDSPWVGTADFGQEFYSSFEATDSAGATGSITDSKWTAIESEAFGSTSDRPTTEPGQLYQGKTSSRSAFEITWERVS
jgi:Peptidase A4 family